MQGHLVTDMKTAFEGRSFPLLMRHYKSERLCTADQFCGHYSKFGDSGSVLEREKRTVFIKNKEIEHYADFYMHRYNLTFTFLNFTTLS